MSIRHVYQGDTCLDLMIEDIMPLYFGHDLNSYKFPIYPYMLVFCWKKAYDKPEYNSFSLSDVISIIPIFPMIFVHFVFNSY